MKTLTINVGAIRDAKLTTGEIGALVQAQILAMESSGLPTGAQLLSIGGVTLRRLDGLVDKLSESGRRFTEILEHTLTQKRRETRREQLSNLRVKKCRANKKTEIALIRGGQPTESTIPSPVNEQHPQIVPNPENLSNDVTRYTTPDFCLEFQKNLLKVPSYPQVCNALHPSTSHNAAPTSHNISPKPQKPQKSTAISCVGDESVTHYMNPEKKLQKKESNQRKKKYCFSILNPPLNNTTYYKNSPFTRLTPHLENAKKEFEELWAKYPRKAGKDSARRAFLKLCRKLGEVERFRGAFAKYLATLERRQTPYEWTQSGSSFFRGRWEEFVVTEEEKLAEERVVAKQATDQELIAQVERQFELIGA